MRKLILAAASIEALTVDGQASAQSPIVIKFSHVVASDTPKGKAADKFKELAEKYTGGKVKVEVYPNSTLYKDKEELEALQLGAVQMLAPSNSKFGPIGIREFEVFDLPYILHIEHGIPAHLILIFIYPLKPVGFIASVIGFFLQGLEIVVFCLAVKQQCIVFSGEIPFSRSAGFVVPDYFIDEVLFPENFIQQNFYIMHHMPVQMHPKAAFL